MDIERVGERGAHWCEVDHTSKFPISFYLAKFEVFVTTLSEVMARLSLESELSSPASCDVSDLKKKR